MEKITYYRLTKEETLADLKTSGDRGLSTDRVSELLDIYGSNELIKAKTKSPLQLFADQFKDFMIGLLIAAAVISGIIGEPADTIAIVVILILNAVIGFVQEYRAEKAIEELQKLSAPQATVLREGRSETISSTGLVPGDIVIIETGNIVPADLRLIQISGLEINESILTGESLPVNKTDEQLTGTHLLAGDQLNMAFSGTQVTKGSGTGIAVSTGMRTEIGKIAGLVHGESSKTPLQKRLSRFGQSLVLVVLGITTIIFVVGIIRGVDPTFMLLTSISIAVAAVPEALPAVVTISLALGARAMVKRRALIRKLPAVETLGSVTYICSDKTGTLTQNKMKVDQIFFNGHIINVTGKGYQPEGEFLNENNDPLNIDQVTNARLFLESAVLNNNSKIQFGDGKEEQIFGDPTELALIAMSAKAKIFKEKTEKIYPRAGEIPFDSERKMMTTLHRSKDGKYFSITKGAIEVLSLNLDNMLVSDSVQSLDQKSREEIDTAVNNMAEKGLRTLAIAYKTYDDIPKINAEEMEKGLTLLGIVGIIDPPRAEAIEAVAESKKAGIKTVMITGDHPATAKTIASRLGIYEEGSLVVTGRQLIEMPLEELEAHVENVTVYARVLPEHKVKIVQALKDRGQIVAMTGDGVNDAPALKNADIGIAMGVTGTDVSKEASHMVLLDDNYATIVNAVMEGRRIFDGINKMLKYILSTNSGEIFLIFFAPLLGLPFPLFPIHILWLNMVTDGLPSLAFAMAPAEENIMDRPPRDTKKGFVDAAMVRYVLRVGLMLAGFGLLLQAGALKSASADKWQTMLFTFMCFAELGAAFALTSEQTSFFKIAPRAIRPMYFAVIGTLILQLTIVYTPFLNPIFKTTPLTALELVFTFILSTVIFFAVEVDKLVKRRYPQIAGM